MRQVKDDRGIWYPQLLLIDDSSGQDSICRLHFQSLVLQYRARICSGHQEVGKEKKASSGFQGIKHNITVVLNISCPLNTEEKKSLLPVERRILLLGHFIIDLNIIIMPYLGRELAIITICR